MPSSLLSSCKPPISISTLRSILAFPSSYRAISVHLMSLLSSSSGAASSAAAAAVAGAGARAFQLRLNPLTGESEWVVVDGDDDDVEEEAEKRRTRSSTTTMATTSYLDMLNDAERNRAFRLAVERTISGPCRVLDIGAGTGLLSMMAARAMAKFDSQKEGKVTACESYLQMWKLMRRVLRANGMETMVKVFYKRSDELQVGVELESPADLLVSEILDSELLGEGLIPTLRHAHDMLLVKNPQTVPYRATTYGQLVESPFLWKMHDLHNNEVNSLDGIHLTPNGLERIISAKPQQYAMHCNAISEEIQLLSEPFKIFEFDFWKRPESYGEKEIQIKAIDDGKVHAVISWWVLQLDSAGSVFYSTAPRWVRSSICQNKSSHIFGTNNWCDHWKQCVWFIDGAGVPALKDKYLSLKATHNETSISYTMMVEKQTSCNHSSLGGHLLVLPPEKVALYGDKDWRLVLSKAVKEALNTRSYPSCIVADDSVFLTTLIASLSKTSHVISIFPGLQDKGARYIQAISDANGFSMDRIKVIGKRTSSLISDDLKQREVDLFVGEPFFYGNEGMLPWQNLRFWRIILVRIVIQDLWRSRRSLKDVEGFDHSAVNEVLGACGDLPTMEEGPCLPYYLWQCGDIKELSNVYSIMEFDFSVPIHACFGKTEIEFSTPGTCHGFALWIDWLINERDSISISTGPVNRYWKQGVQLISKPVVVNVASCYAKIEAFFDPSTGELSIKPSFSYPS
ncbi:Protein arginine N-methyltransferase 7 [Ananas comosus]|uniref:Protein arginine N-methyltransferase 7 n=1 Tax=Ananas comosus TaxID=4615 RepID=A0A199VSG1_ANACO|nr:Protein arginine N-methyltransferase 7 [Ananas comosus]